MKCPCTHLKYLKHLTLTSCPEYEIRTLKDPVLIKTVLMTAVYQRLKHTTNHTSYSSKLGTNVENTKRKMRMY